MSSGEADAKHLLCSFLHCARHLRNCWIGASFGVIHFSYRRRGVHFPGIGLSYDYWSFGGEFFYVILPERNFLKSRYALKFSTYFTTFGASVPVLSIMEWTWKWSFPTLFYRFFKLNKFKYISIYYLSKIDFPVEFPLKSLHFGKVEFSHYQPMEIFYGEFLFSGNIPLLEALHCTWSLSLCKGN